MLCSWLSSIPLALNAVEGYSVPMKTLPVTAKQGRTRGLRIIGVLACLAVAWACPAATLYKWVDENGVTHYSDQPHDGAEKIQVANAQTYPSGNAASGNAKPGPATPARAPAVKYRRVAISSPLDGDVFVNTGGRVPVAIDLDPGLAPGHQLWFTLDGQRIDSLGSSAMAGTLSDLERGSHTLFVQVVDASGTALLSSDPVTFTIRQPIAKR